MKKLLLLFLALSLLSCEKDIIEPNELSVEKVNQNSPSDIVSSGDAKKIASTFINDTMLNDQKMASTKSIPKFDAKKDIKNITQISDQDGSSLSVDDLQDMTDSF